VLAKTSCQHCGIHIEFEAEEANRFAPCPSCGKQTRLLLPQSQTAKPLSKNQGRDLKKWIFFICASILAVLITFLSVKFEAVGEAVAKSVGLAGGFIVGCIAVALAIFAFILAVLWTIFPLFVYNDLKAMRKLLGQIRDK
jgi:hypothetical protein